MSFIVFDSKTVQTNESVSVVEELPTSVYRLCYSDRSGYFLTDTKEDYRQLDKLNTYGGLTTRADRIIETFKRREKTTGVLLTGEKGAGKTLLAKHICKMSLALEYPVIVVEEALYGNEFDQFMNSESMRKKPFVVLFEEFEKVYNEHKHIEGLLGFLDGAVPSKKLCIFTANSKHSCDQLVNRPSRVYYTFHYGTLNEATIREVCDDKLRICVSSLENRKVAPKANKLKDQIVLSSKLLGGFNFDMLISLIEELNAFPNTSVADAVDMLGFQGQYLDINYLVEGFVEGSSEPFVTDDFYFRPASEKRTIRCVVNGEEEMSEFEITPDEIVDFRDGIYTYRFIDENNMAFTFKARPMHRKVKDFQDRMLAMSGVV